MTLLFIINWTVCGFSRPKRYIVLLIGRSMFVNDAISGSLMTGASRCLGNLTGILSMDVKTPFGVLSI